MTIKFSLKNKNRRVRSAVHRAVSIRKLNSPPVNHPKPKIKVGVAVEHLCGAVFESLCMPLFSHANRKIWRCQDLHNMKKNDRLITIGENQDLLLVCVDLRKQLVVKWHLIYRYLHILLAP